MRLLRSTIVAVQAVIIVLLLFWIYTAHPEDACVKENAMIADLMKAAEEQKKAPPGECEEPAPDVITTNTWEKRATSCEYSRWLQNGDQPRGIDGNRKRKQ